MKKRILLMTAITVIGLLAGCAAKTFKIDYSGEKQLYDGAEDAYSPGASVTLRYTLGDENTVYTFYLDGEKIEAEYDEKKGYFVKFTMPDHDVKLESVEEKVTAEVIPEPEAEKTDSSPAKGNKPRTKPGTKPEAKPEEDPAGKPVSKPEVISLTKQLRQQAEWDEETAVLLAMSKYDQVALFDSDSSRFPALADILEQAAAMQVRSMEDEYDNLLAIAKDELPYTEPEYFTTKTSTLEMQVRRADSVAVSLLSDSYLDNGWIEGYRGFFGTNYDAETGKELALSDVVKTMKQIPAIITNELNSHIWAGDLWSEDVVTEYFKNTPEDCIRWTLDYNGVTFYFADGELSEPGNGCQSATVSFAEYPELFNEKYLTVPDGYMVELPLDHSFFTDLDGNGDLEELNVTGFYNYAGMFYSDFGVYTDTDGYFHYEEYYAYDYHPYYVKTADGGHFLYIFCEGTDAGMRDMSLVVFDVKNGVFERIGEMHAGPGYIPSDIFRLPTDPEKFYLDDYESMAQDATAFKVGPDGMPMPQ